MALLIIIFIAAAIIYVVSARLFPVIGRCIDKALKPFKQKGEQKKDNE